MRSVIVGLALSLVGSPSVGQSIQADSPEDPRMKVALHRLTEAAAEGPGTGCDYAIGASAARSVLPSLQVDGLGPEGFVIRTVRRAGERPCVVVAGETLQGSAYGVFRLARILRSAPDRLARLDLRMRPYFPIREVYEEHGWATPSEMTRYRGRIERYFEEGVNTLDMAIGWFISPPEYVKHPSAKRIMDAFGEPARFPEDFATARKAIDYAHSLGIKVNLLEGAYLNPLYNETLDNIRGMDKARFDQTLAVGPGARDPLLLCLADPISRDLLRRSREIIYRALPEADGVVIYFGDPGGCLHPGCMPHGRKIVEYLNEIYAPLIRAARPDLKVVLTLWGIGLSDTEYVLTHLAELPAFVKELQVPPTSMEPGRYMLYEARRGALIGQAGKTLPVTLQQFWEGVGYRDSWIDVWEHPMPREMANNLRKTLAAGGARPAGVYGSSFELDNQLVNLRLGMEWAWQPGRSPDDILREFGDEQFGRGTGPAFARAMAAMEDYWASERRRFFFDGTNLTAENIRSVRRALARAQSALADLRRGQAVVVRSKVYYEGFIELAEMMMTCSEMVLLKQKSRDLLDAGRQQEAAAAAEAAGVRADRVVKLVAGSSRYAWLMKHMWWSNWDIGRRPGRLAAMALDARQPARWRSVSIDDPSFEQKAWSGAGEGSLAYVGGARTGTYAARATVGAETAWCVVSPPRAVTVQPGARYRVEFWARPVNGTPRMYLDLCGDEIDGPNAEVSFAAGRAWRRYRVELDAPAVVGPTPLALRFVVHGGVQEVLLDDVQVSERSASGKEAGTDG